MLVAGIILVTAGYLVCGSGIAVRMLTPVQFVGSTLENCTNFEFFIIYKATLELVLH